MYIASEVQCVRWLYSTEKGKKKATKKPKAKKAKK